MDASAFSPDLRGLAARVAERVGAPQAAGALTLVRERAPDERLALAMLLKLAEYDRDRLARALADPALGSDLIFCLGGSELVGDGLAATGAEWPALFAAARSVAPTELMRAIAFAPGAPEAADAAALGAFKRREFLKIAIADLLGRAGVLETTGALSRLADECIRGALGIALAATGDRAGLGADFCVVAMGKLGARELNLSSDIDLVYLFAGAADAARLEAASRLGETLTELLAARCFRVDLRLRPGGRGSPLAIPLVSALRWYESMGDTWERAALLRARPAAGAIAAGARLLEDLAPFIYRRYLDFDTLRQLRAMKRQIERELGSPERVARDLKLGRGGIRELEFFVQSLTLIYGGRDPRLRTTGTIGAIDRLEAHDYLAARLARKLREAYLLLRDAEHKLQVVAGLQTHALPATPAAFAALAARMGFGKGTDAPARLGARLRESREFVARQFREMLAGGGERGEHEASASALAAWRAAGDRTQAAAALKELGFAHPAESANHLALLAEGAPRASSSPRRRELIERLSPALIDEIRTLADPDLALRNLASFIAAVGARTSFLALLEEHPATRQALLKLFASSDHLSTLFIRHPELLDTLVRSDLARTRRRPEQLRAELRGLVAASGDFEARLDAIRSFRHQEFLRIAIADLAGGLELEELQTELTHLAETVLGEALRLARAEVGSRRGLPAGLALCAIAMGRLGAAEMSYNSDLDLIFVYHLGGEANGMGHEGAARVVQKLIAILEAPTREGIAYKIDLRLRPSGNAGPLVASLGGFREYHRQSSSVWERQALVRARVIAGDKWLWDEVEEARREFVYGRGIGAAEVAEIAAMRARMEREIGAESRERLNLKQGRGGLVDIEFLTQMMALRHGHAFPELRRRGTIALIRALGEARLIPGRAAEELEADYRFLTRLENRLRIETDQAAWALPTKLDDLAPLARRMGYEGAGAAAQLRDELERRRGRVRAAFEACFAREREVADGPAGASNAPVA